MQDIVLVMMLSMCTRNLSCERVAWNLVMMEGLCLKFCLVLVGPLLNKFLGFIKMCFVC